MSSGNEIAIVGMSGRFPGASSVDALWDVLASGAEPLRDTSQDATAPGMGEGVAHMVKANSLLPDLDLFDAAFFGFNPREAEMTDPQHRVFLECAWEAMENAGLKAGDRARPIGVFAGAGASSYVFGQIGLDGEILDAFPSIVATDRDFIATRTSFKLNLTGPSMTVQCACSTSMVAVHLACQSLIAGECDAALAGGVTASVPQHASYKYLPGAMLSPDGRCRPFDAEGRGTVFADGAAALVLMRLDDALAGGFPIRAVILGSAVNNDGSQKPGYTAPTVEGQVRVVNQALSVAGVGAADIDFIEAHGTGTILGDAIEIGALTKVLRQATDGVGVCTLGSIKSNIGHVLAAAGAAGIVKTVLSLENRAIPACPNFRTPNPDLDLATSPFTVNTVLKPWDKPTNGIRRAGVSSFGVGGTNAHVILEEAPARHFAPSRRRWHVLPISARDETALGDLKQLMQGHFEAQAEASFADSVYTAQVGRRAFEHRSALVASSAADAAAALAKGDNARLFSRKAPSQPAKLAFLFTGQGSQAPGMGAELFRDEPVFAAAVDRCLACLDAETAGALRALVFSPASGRPEDEARLQQTEMAQIALFVMHHSLAALLKGFGVTPDLMIGHSIGEFAAACLSGVMTLPEAMALVAARGRLMGEMPVGTMLSVAADPDDLPTLSDGLSIAAVNAPKLLVVAGPSEAVTIYENALGAAGIGSRRLNTSHAFHSAMMEPMLPRFRAEAERVAFQAPTIPYISSLTGRLVTPAEARDPGFWTRQIREPVAFAAGCATLADVGATVIVEIGPGRSLSALARQCGLAARGIDIVTMLPGSTEAGFELAAALGRVWTAGIEVEWTALHANERRLRVPLPTYPFHRQSYWIDPAVKFKAPETAEKRADVARWLYAPAWKQLGPVAVALSGAERAAQHVLLVGGTGPLAGALAARIEGAGDAVTQLADTSPAALDALVAGWTDAADAPDRILHLSSLEPGANLCGGLDEASFWQRQERDVLGLLRLLQTVSSISMQKPLAVHVVSTGLFDVTGSDDIVPDNAPFLTFARVAAQEVANVTCRILDIETPGATGDANEMAARIEARLAASGPKDTVVALRKRRAWRLDFAEIDAGAAAMASTATKEKGVYLITGGLGKVGLVFARHLAATCRARLVLVGRSGLPDEAQFDALLADPSTDADLAEKISAIRELAAMGAEVMAASADAADAAAMERVVAAAEARFGRIDGVVHCAGTTTVGAVVLDTGRSEFEQNFRSKVFGLAVLQKIFAGRRLDFGIVVSSLSAVLGGIGHMAYAAANAVADAMVHAQNQTGESGPWTAVDWDAWKIERGRIDHVQAILNKLDLSLDEDEGSRAIDLILSMPEPEQVIVSTGSLPARVEMWIERHADIDPAGGERAGGQYQRPDVETPFEEPSGPIEIRLAAIWRDALGLDRVGRHDDFFEIGGHSLLAVQILAKTREAFGIDFPLDRAMDAARLSSAAAVIGELLDTKLVREAAE